MHRVAIIGGGLAGLAAAESLSRLSPDLETQITVFEAKRQTGGRAGSFLDSQGNSVDYCQHVAMGCCTHFLDFIEQIGVADQFRRYDELTFLHTNGTRSRFRASKFLPAPLHLAGSLLGLRYLSLGQKLRICRGVHAMMRTVPSEMGDATADRWLQRHGQDRRTIQEFWDVVLVSALGELTKHVSARAARKVFIDGFAVHRSASDVWVPQRSLAELFGKGAIDPLRERGVVMRCETPVQQILTGDDLQRAHPFLLRTSNHQDYEADAIILAVPWYALNKIRWNEQADLPIEKLREVQSIPTSPITGVHLWFDRPITDLMHAVLVGTTSQWLFRDPIAKDASGTSVAKPGKETAEDEKTTDQEQHYYQVVISASPDGRQLTKSALLDVVLKELKQFFPDARKAQLVRSRVVTDPKSVFSIRPEVDAIRPSSHSRVPGLFLAGDWVQTQWPATMEGAIRSGRSAAAATLAMLERPPLVECQDLTPGWLASLLIRHEAEKQGDPSESGLPPI